MSIEEKLDGITRTQLGGMSFTAVIKLCKERHIAIDELEKWLCSKGLRYRIARMRAKVTPEAAADALGIDHARLRELEADATEASIEELIAMARAYRCTTDELLGLPA